MRRMTLTGLAVSLALAFAAPALSQDQAMTLDPDGNVGIGAPAQNGPRALLDIGQRPRTGSHPDTLSTFYATGDLPSARPSDGDAPGIEFRHTNGTQGIGFGYNTIYATGTLKSQNLDLSPMPDGKVRVLGPLEVTGTITNTSLEKRLAALEHQVKMLVPVGSIVAWAGGLGTQNRRYLRDARWIVANGRSLSRTEFSDLFEAIGTAHGAEDDDHFNVPDLRGRFVRGVGESSDNDPDADSRTADRVGANQGNKVGSYQADDFKAHGHKIWTIKRGAGGIGSAGKSPYHGDSVKTDW